MLDEFCSYITRFRAPERISGESAYFFTHLMAAVEFIEKMDRESLTISEEAYENFMEAAVSQLNNHQQPQSDDGDETDSLTEKIDEKLDFAEAKAEEFFLKAKEAFKATGERANQAFSSFKESKIAKKSVEKLNQFFKEMTEATATSSTTQNEAETTTRQLNNDEIFEEEIVRALANSSADQDLMIDRSADYTDEDGGTFESNIKLKSESQNDDYTEEKNNNDNNNDIGEGATINNK